MHLDWNARSKNKASLVALAKSRTTEARAVERARIILACLEGKGDSASGSGTEGLYPLRFQMAPTLLALWGLRGLRDRSRPGKPSQI